MDLTASLACCPCAPRSHDRVRLYLLDLIRQRVSGFGLGYEDCSDPASLRSDCALKLSLRRGPLECSVLASQPTLSRFENTVTRGDLLKSQRRPRRKCSRQPQATTPPARCITIDFEPTCHPTHGSQQRGLFNGFYNTASFLPRVTTPQIDNDPEHYLVSAVLRLGNSPVLNSTVS